MSILSHLCIPGLLPCEVGASVSFRKVLRVASLLIPGQNVSFFSVEYTPSRRGTNRNSSAVFQLFCDSPRYEESCKVFFSSVSGKWSFPFHAKGIMMFTQCLDICPQRSTSGSGFCHKQRRYFSRVNINLFWFSMTGRPMNRCPLKQQEEADTLLKITL